MYNCTFTANFTKSTAALPVSTMFFPTPSNVAVTFRFVGGVLKQPADARNGSKIFFL
jgi:hypothetical protein